MSALATLIGGESPSVPLRARRMWGMAKLAGGIALGATTGKRAFVGPLHAQIGLADPCNHRCVMCWDHPPDDREDATTALRFANVRQGVMGLEQFQRVVDDLYVMGTRRIDIVGRGEPTLHKDVAAMVAFAKSRSMYVTMTTNGSRLDPQLAEALVRAGINRLRISMNAGTAETYPKIHQTESPERFVALKERLANLVQEKRRQRKSAPILTLGFVISALNYHEVEQMVEVAAEIGADTVNMVHTVAREITDDLCLSKDQYAELLRLLERAQRRAADLHVETNIPTLAATVPTYFERAGGRSKPVPCYVGWYFSLILANGSVLPCCQCTSAVGSVREQPFAQIWKSDRYNKFRAAAKALPNANPALASCECDRCMLKNRNESIHRTLHPLEGFGKRSSAAQFTILDLFRLRKVDKQDLDVSDLVN